MAHIDVYVQVLRVEYEKLMAETRGERLAVSREGVEAARSITDRGGEEQVQPIHLATTLPYQPRQE